MQTSFKIDENVTHETRPPAPTQPAAIELPPPTATAAQIQEIMAAFWQQQMNEIENGTLDFKFHQLPLARVKKVMKADEDAKNMMISAEAPLIFSKACEIFILELTMRAWIHTEEHKRRTLQKSDVATAISKADMYDFLIDIVPREEANKPPNKDPSAAAFAAFYQNPAQYLQHLTPEQQQALLAYQLSNSQVPQAGQSEQEAARNQTPQPHGQPDGNAQQAPQHIQPHSSQAESPPQPQQTPNAEQQFYLQHLQAQMQVLQHAQQMQNQHQLQQQAQHQQQLEHPQNPQQVQQQAQKQPQLQQAHVQHQLEQQGQNQQQQIPNQPQVQQQTQSSQPQQPQNPQQKQEGR